MARVSSFRVSIALTEISGSGQPTAESVTYRVNRQTDRQAETVIERDTVICIWTHRRMKSFSWSDAKWIYDNSYSYYSELCSCCCKIFWHSVDLFHVSRKHESNGWTAFSIGGNTRNCLFHVTRLESNRNTKPKGNLTLDVAHINGIINWIECNAEQTWLLNRCLNRCLYLTGALLPLCIIRRSTATTSPIWFSLFYVRLCMLLWFHLFPSVVYSCRIFLFHFLSFVGSCSHVSPVHSLPDCMPICLSVCLSIRLPVSLCVDLIVGLHLQDGPSTCVIFFATILSDLIRWNACPAVSSYMHQKLIACIGQCSRDFRLATKRTQAHHDTQLRLVPVDEF